MFNKEGMNEGESDDLEKSLSPERHTEIPSMNPHQSFIIDKKRTS